MLFFGIPNWSGVGNSFDFTHHIQWRSQKFAMGLANSYFLSKRSPNIRLSYITFEIQFCLVLSSFDLGVQMPHCTPSGYSTGHISDKLRRYPWDSTVLLG
jgi:hypothetical protein